ncbi:MAG: exodeoxyribonuclease V subunit gamma [Oscillospiraceae bacterium]|nr:exodeoxyribonuclease V subunit gamma [Oscillospiraceae bacterium]
MLELIIGKDWTANTDTVLARIAEDVHRRRGGRILLVPELVSHDMERRLCEAAGDTASRYAEVLSFTRLARRVSDSAGSAAMECLDNGGRVVAMAAAARQLHSRLKAYAAVETKPEFLTQLVNAVDEFKRCCITAQQLRRAAAQAEGALAQKLEELSLLLESYDALCAQGKRDPRDLMNWVLEELEDSDFARERVFYIDGFPDFTRQHMAVLEHLIKESPQVTVSLNCDQVSSRLMAFEKAGETAAQIVKCAKAAGVPVKITVIEEQNIALSPVRQYLFQGKIPQEENVSDRLRLYTADSTYQECRAAAMQIMELVRGGCRYRDISVVCGDMAAYAPVIGLVFRRLGIPVYLSGTEDILNKSAVTTVLAALEAALGGFEQKAVLRYLRSVLSPVDAEVCDLVENYAIIWGISGNRWKEPFENHPEGLSGVWNSHAQRTLDTIETARRRAIEPLERLQKGFREATKLSEQVMALYAFLEDIRLAQRLMKLADELNEEGDNRSAQILNQLWEILLTALEQLYDVLGQTQWDDEAFGRLFTLLLSQYDVGTIPTVLDSVTVGSVSSMRCQREKHLFVLGAAEGSLPGFGGSNGVLTDQERDALRRLDITLTGGAMEGIQNEFAEVYGVFCGASETITVSCSGAQPSYVYRRLAQLAGGESKPDTQLVPTADRVDAAGVLGAYGAQTQARELGIDEEYAELSRRSGFELGTVSREHVTQLYGEKLTLSASQVDRQAECRLSYFLKYGLRARERKEAVVDPAEFGTYVHAVLENTAREVMEKGGFRQVSLDDTLAIAKRHSDAYAAEHFSQLTSQRSEYLFRRNMQELDLVVQELWEELSAGQYAPADFELHFGTDGKMPAIGVPSKEMTAVLQGFVDRVDTFEVAGVKYFRVVDYKTGKKEFDYCDVFNGVGLQMLLYLFALEQKGQEMLGDRRIAAGVQYFPARVPYVNLDGAGESENKDRRANWKRRGLLLADELSLEAMDPLEDMPRLNCKRKKDGTLTGDLASREQLKQLRQYVFAVLGNMVDEIASGKVEANPYTRGSSHDACAFCPYGAICHKQSVQGRRNYKTMSAQRFWEEIDKEVKSHG